MDYESRIRAGMAATSSTHRGEGDISARKRDIRRLADASAPERRKWLARAAFFNQEDLFYLKFLIPEGIRVLELGCGTGDRLAALKPSSGVTRILRPSGPHTTYISQPSGNIVPRREASK
jgi:hypothetical protein